MSILFARFFVQWLFAAHLHWLTGLWHIKYKHMHHAGVIYRENLYLVPWTLVRKSHAMCSGLENICTCCSSHPSSFLKAITCGEAEV